jgi:hypothetical protein
MVTIDVDGATISGNTFTRETARFATGLRARGPDTDVENNVFDNSLGGDTRGVFIVEQGEPGSYANNEFIGGAEDDLFQMSPGEDVATGGAGDDTFLGGAGDDEIDGGDGVGDTARYVGARSDYAVAKIAEGEFTVTGPTEGADTLTGVEALDFLSGGADLELDANSPDYAAAFKRFAQGSETDSAGFRDEISGWAGAITLPPTGTDGIDSPEGAQHALFEQTTTSVGLFGPFSRLGGSRTELGDGLITRVSVSLDPGAWDDGEGFDMSAAAITSSGAFLRDFIFHITQDTSSGALLMGGSNNTKFDAREDLDTINSVEITAAGWRLRLLRPPRQLRCRSRSGAGRRHAGLVVTDTVGSDGTDYLIDVGVARFTDEDVRVFGASDTVAYQVDVAIDIDVSDLLANDVDSNLEPVFLEAVFDGDGRWRRRSRWGSTCAGGPSARSYGRIWVTSVIRRRGSERRRL